MNIIYFSVVTYISCFDNLSRFVQKHCQKKVVEEMISEDQKDSIDINKTTIVPVRPRR